MACEPCIRGHRSTKCNHASERLMVPVRKPGRPLSSCPHPASRPCSCVTATVTAAIPKKQKCSCGPSEQPAVDSIENKDGSSVGASSPSPPKAPSTSGHRIQKPTSKSGPSRKPIDPTALERMDASQLNILPTFGAGQQKSSPASNGIMVAMPSNAGYGTIGLVPQTDMFMFQSPIPPSMNSIASTNGHHTAHAQMNGLPGSATASTAGSCCGGGETKIQTTAKTNGLQKEKPKSCCSGADSPEIKSQEEIVSTQGALPQANGIMMSPFSGPIVMPNGIYPYFPQPTVFAYPPQYGSYLQPLQPEQWRHIMASINFGQPIPSLPYGVPPTIPMPPINHTGGPSWTSHQCGCGDSCECVGCATHPYNEATQNYVRSAWSTVVEDAQKAQNLGGENQNAVNGNHGTPAGQTSTIGTPTMKQNDGTVSPPTAHTPSDAASGISEEQTLHHGSSHRTRERDDANIQLPFSARPLTKGDLSTFEPLLAEYLDLQKQKMIEDMDEREIRGRWKSFVSKWNRNELAEGWYDPEMFQRILERGPPLVRLDAMKEQSTLKESSLKRPDDADSDDEDYGPVLPGTSSSRKAGVAIPSLQDLALRNELIEESREAEREELRANRKADRALQKEQLEELVPRAEAGTRERKLEKRQEVNDKMRQFREKSPGMEVGDKDLMGGGDGLEEYKQAKEKEHKRKSEREVRREELARARREEIEEKRRAWQQREDKTVSMLKELAKQRFG
ncbi:Protein GRISEA [Cladobotryum mycophilum]|uniref:Protein GRISEA n=1 Tax=Cladobotryum mycophilum TaxID=491253 RepID=A0ABR0SSQ9_9HYPO